MKGPSRPRRGGSGVAGLGGGYRDGMHTLTACGDMTLFDVKRVDRSLRGLVLDVRRALGGFG